MAVAVRVLDDVGVEILGRERLDLLFELGRGGRARRLLFAQEDGGVPVDPVLQRLEAVVALVNDWLEFAARQILSNVKKHFSLMALQEVVPRSQNCPASVVSMQAAKAD